MSSEILKRDENHMAVGAGISNDVNQEILMLRVDAATDYLLADISETPATAANSGQIAKRDQNHRAVAMGWNEDTQQPEEILTDSDGYILCDLLIV